MIRTENVRIERAGITEKTDLGLAMLVAEAEDGAYQPVAMVSSIREALEIAEYNFQARIKELESAEDTMCPARYVIWAPDGSGDYKGAATIELD